MMEDYGPYTPMEELDRLIAEMPPEPPRPGPKPKPRGRKGGRPPGAQCSCGVCLPCKKRQWYWNRVNRGGPLTAEERQEQARKAVAARWAKNKLQAQNA